MEIPVTLLLPEPFYRQAETIAVAGQKTVAQVLLERLLDDSRLSAGDWVDAEQAILEREVAAYKTLHPALLKTYRGQWVAIHHGRLVDSDWDADALLTRLGQAFPGETILARQVEAEPDREIYIPSFHFVQ